MPLRYRHPVPFLVGIVWVLSWGCSESRTFLGADLGPPPPAAFVEPDSGGDVVEEDSFRTYCASDRCPAGYATCADSKFACDADLLTDPFNCGSCGHVCPTRGTGQSYSCLNGRCEMVCNSAYLDCDRVPDNGCEVRQPNDAHCGHCGNECPADKPCVAISPSLFQCGCPDGLLYCAGLGCVDPTTDDENCGACGNACSTSPPGDAGPPPPNTYYGSVAGVCDSKRPKCLPFWGDCDANLGNGCEQRLITDEHCLSCGSSCTGGQTCAWQVLGLAPPVPACVCPQGRTFCTFGTTEGRDVGTCIDLSSDVENCGNCGSACPGARYNDYPVCDFGKCTRTCNGGWADCNGNSADGCETHVASDPKNCGACGRVCDGIAGQACVGGECVTEPCDVDAGGIAR